MPAYFSPRDNRDEQGGRLYGVIGHIERENPELTLRLGMFGHWLHNVPGQAVFDDVHPFIEVAGGDAPVDDDHWALSENNGGLQWLTNLFNRGGK